MSDAFAAAAEQFEKSQSAEQASPDTNQEDLAPSLQGTQDSQQTSPPKGDVALAIAELDKMDKFKLDGQEWTLKDLKAAIMRQKDYTQKTQGLAEERKSLESERKFHENLAWDLMKVRENPTLAAEFVKVYPQKFHSHVEEFLKNNQAQGEPQQVQRPQVDVQLLSRLDALEKFRQEQETVKQETRVAEAEKSIQSTLEKFSKTYPDAANFKEMVLGRAFEAQTALHKQSPGAQLDDQMWEEIFKSVNQEVGDLLKAKYGSLVKKQTEKNAQSRDVGPGGGTAGRAPQKFKSFDDLNKYALGVANGD